MFQVDNQHHPTAVDGGRMFGNQLVHPSAAPKPGAAPPGQQAHG